MQSCRLGRTDLTIAPIVLGGNVFGWTIDKTTSFAVLDRFAASGAARSIPPTSIRRGRPAIAAANRKRSSASG